MIKVRTLQGARWLAGSEPLVLLFLSPWLLWPHLAPRVTALALLVLPLLWMFCVLLQVGR